MAVFAVSAAPASANPADIFGFGARGQAMAGAQVAAADDTSANYYNPALLIGTDDIRIDLGYQAAQPRLSIDDHDTGVDSSRGLAIGIAVPGRLAGARLAIGASMFLPDQHLTRTRTRPSGQPRWQIYDNRPQRALFVANLAVELPYGLSIGGGLAYMASTEGTVDLEGVVGFPEPATSQLDLAIDVDLTTLHYLHAGVAWEARPWLRIAASYRGGFALELDQAFNIVGDIGVPGSEPIVDDGYLFLHTRAQDLFQPVQVTAGFDAQLTPRLDLAFDLTWHRWGAFENPAATIDLDLDVGEFNDLVDIPAQDPLPAPGFHDIMSVRLGAEYLLAAATRRSWRVRGGYGFEPSPAPEQVGTTNFVDGDKHGFSLGGGVELRGLGDIIVRPVSFDLALMTTWLPERIHRKSFAADPVGDFTAGGVVLAAGVQSRWRF